MLKQYPKYKYILALADYSLFIVSFVLAVWARFYEIGTNRRLFGDRDGTIHTDVQEISHERRNGYAWYVESPRSALEKYEKWAAKISQAIP